ncbi:MULTISPECIES: hypothetical protein [Rhizobium]|uniref:hypothetical protein n=2 Tax=Rhizobium/Agrobacterium group TaxID=227290 RepID=UPI000B13020F|nr:MULTISPECIES: hypothetical protein [Rhizobium]NKJ35747.1 hypothetical protein [Rhizobium sp. SG570]
MDEDHAKSNSQSVMTSEKNVITLWQRKLLAFVELSARIQGLVRFRLNMPLKAHEEVTISIPAVSKMIGPFTAPRVLGTR